MVECLAVQPVERGTVVLLIIRVVGESLYEYSSLLSHLIARLALVVELPSHENCNHNCDRQETRHERLHSVGSKCRGLTRLSLTGWLVYYTSQMPGNWGRWWKSNRTARR